MNNVVIHINNNRMDEAVGGAMWGIAAPFKIPVY